MDTGIFLSIHNGWFSKLFLKREKIPHFQIGAVPIQVSDFSIQHYCRNALKIARKIVDMNKINYQDISLQTYKNRSLQKNRQCERAINFYSTDKHYIVV